MLRVQHQGLKAVSPGLSSGLLPVSTPGPLTCSQPPGTPFASAAPQELPACGTHGFVVSPQVWPGFTAFADFSNPDTHQWWLENLQHFHAHVPFDGLWIVSPFLPSGRSLPVALPVPGACLSLVPAGLSVPQMQLFQVYPLIP